MNSRLRNLSIIQPAAAVALCLASGCLPSFGDPSRATRPYPATLAKGTSSNIQAIPGETSITLTNATPVTYADFDLWLNRRYVRRIALLGAGQSIEVPTQSFYDEWGGCPFVGGFWRSYDPTPIVLLQIQVAPDQPLVGLICALPESVRE